MPRTRLVILAAVSSALVAGCGGASPSAPSAPSQPKANTTAPANGGALRVGVTNGGIGTAISGSDSGVRNLPNTKVPGESNTRQGVGAGATCENTDITPAADNLDTVVDATLCLLNGERADAGLPALKINVKLTKAAAQHSADMVDQQYFDHVAKDGTDPVARIKAAGYIPQIGIWTVGENLAWGTGSLATPKEIVAAWMNSTGHRENILRSSFKEIGFGVVVGNPRSVDGQGATYTTTFGGITGAPKVTPKVTPKKTKKARKAARRARRAREARAARNRRSAKVAKVTAKTTNPSGSRKRTNPSGSRKTTKPSGSH